MKIEVKAHVMDVLVLDKIRGQEQLKLCPSGLPDLALKPEDDEIAGAPGSVNLAKIPISVDLEELREDGTIAKSTRVFTGNKKVRFDVGPPGCALLDGNNLRAAPDKDGCAGVDFITIDAPRLDFSDTKEFYDFNGKWSLGGQLPAGVDKIRIPLVR